MARAPFKPNATIIQAFLEGPAIRADLERRAARVADLARRNADGLILSRRSGDLYNGIRYTLDRDSEGLYAIIGTNARHRDFSYPAFLENQGFRWLTKALEDGWDWHVSPGLSFVRSIPNRFIGFGNG